MKIVISSKTLAIIEKLKSMDSQVASRLTTFSLKTSHLELVKLQEWLAQNQESIPTSEEEIADSQILWSSLNSSLINDLAKSLPGYKKKKKQKISPDWLSYLKFSFLALAGTLIFGGEGFDGMTSIISYLPLSLTTLFTIGVVFAFISIIAFYAFNLTDVASNLEIKKKEKRQWVDQLLKEEENIKQMRKNLQNNLLRQESSDLSEKLIITNLLIARYQALDKSRQAVSDLLNNKPLILTKYFIGTTLGVLSFSAGFFAGQAVVLVIVGLFTASTSIAFWPIFVVGSIVGLTAFGLYWISERPTVEKQICQWFGVDQEKIEKLCDSDKTEDQNFKLENLKNNLIFFYNQSVEINKRKELKIKINQSSNSNFFSTVVQDSEERRVILRSKTKTLIYNKLNTNKGIKLSKFIRYFQSNSKSEDRASALLNASLLKDLAYSLDPKPKDKKNKQSFSLYLYGLLGIAGSIYFGCEGFAGITSIIGIFLLPKALIFVTGILFSMFAVAAFLFFDLRELGNDLGIKQAKIKIEEIYIKEVNAIKSICKSINNHYFKYQCLKELEEDLLIVDLLIARYKKLDKKKEELSNSLKSNKLIGLKYFVASTIGLLYFSGGFFTGQAVAVAIAGLFAATTSSFFWPILVTSILFALAALTVYWIVERPRIEKLVSHLCGLDEAKIENLVDPEKSKHQKAKLEILKGNLIQYKKNFIEDKKDEKEMENKIGKLEEKPKKEKKSVDSLAVANDCFFNIRNKKHSNSVNELSSSALKLF